MPSYRVSAVPLCATVLIVAAALTACATSRLSSELPPGVHLAGDWKIDTPRSDDLGKAVDELRAQAEKARRARESRQAQGASVGTGVGTGLGPTRGSPVDELMSNVPRGDYLRISVSASSFTVASGDSSDQYTPGLQSEISAEQGDAQQISGWKGADYVIDTRPQWGAEVIQRYGLTKDGKLAMTLRLTGRGTKLTFTRVYDRTTRMAPLAPPTIN